MWQRSQSGELGMCLALIWACLRNVHGFAFCGSNREQGTSAVQLVEEERTE